MGVKVRKLRGKWGVVVHFKGQRITQVIGTKVEAEQAAEEIRLRLQVLGAAAFEALKRPAKAPVVKFGPFATAWLAELEETNLAGRKESTVARHKLAIEKHLQPHFGDLALTEIGYPPIKAFIQAESKTLARNTVRNHVATLRLVMREAVREGHVATNPVRDLADLYRSKREEADPFTLAELRALEGGALAHFPAFYPLVLVLSRTGMRVGEARALQWQDVDFRRGVIHVRRNKPTGFVVTTPKTKASRRAVDASEELLDVLRLHRGACKALALEKSREFAPWVFATRTGQPTGYNNFRCRVWDRLLRKLDLRHRGVHQLRHTFASLLLSAGENILYVSKQLGHASPNVTLGIYSHWIPEESTRRGVSALDVKGESLSGNRGKNHLLDGGRFNGNES